MESQQNQTLVAGLYIIATPIGNLADITVRALDVLQEVDLILCEDTRTSRILLDRYQIKSPCKALHRFNEASSMEALLARVKSGEKLAIISDAGTPLISDPGSRLVAAFHEYGLKVVPIPGSSSVIAALSASGLFCDHFEFIGFLPSKQHARQLLVSSWEGVKHPVVCFEVPHRIHQTLLDMVEGLSDEREIVLARELTKTFETILRMRVGDLTDWLLTKPVLKGEWVVMVGPSLADVSEISDLAKNLLKELSGVCSVKDAVAITARVSGDKKNSLYDFAMQLKEQ